MADLIKTGAWQKLSAGLIFSAFFVPLLAAGAGLILDVSPLFTGESGLLQDPRLIPALKLTLFTGIGATVLSLALTLLILVSCWNTWAWRWVSAWIPPVLAMPHAALAVGLLFVLMPAGFLVRLVSPWLTGWDRPPLDWPVPDELGISLILALVIKETPFLLLSAMAQLQALDVPESLRIGRSLGYSPARCWSRLILPRLYRRIRLMLMVVLAFNLGVVDMAILIGPDSPPVFSVVLLDWMYSPDTRGMSAFGSVLLLGVVVCCFAGLLLLERLFAATLARRRVNGKRGLGFVWLRRLGQLLVIILIGLTALSIGINLIQSISWRWPFPGSLPDSWSTRHWVTHAVHLRSAVWSTVGFAVGTAVVTLATAVTWLELERLRKVPRLDGLWLLPLLIPQMSFLFGWHTIVYRLGMDTAWLTVLHSHWLYAFPYAVLLLAVAWRDQDRVWDQAAASLGAGYWRTLWRVRVPLLSSALAQVAAVAVAVSVAQYLPTLLLGGGRHQTLALDLVASASGSDRRLQAALAVLQSVIPLLVFSAALLHIRRRDVSRFHESNAVESAHV